MNRGYLKRLIREIIIRPDYTELSGKRGGSIVTILRTNSPFRGSNTIRDLRDVRLFTTYTMDEIITLECDVFNRSVFDGKFRLFSNNAVIFEYPQYRTYALRLGERLPDNPTNKSTILWDLILTYNFSNAYQLYHAYEQQTEDLGALYNEFCVDANRDLAPDLGTVVPLEKYYRGKS